MPYIRQEDRALLDPQIKNLQAKVSVLNLSGDFSVAWGYARYACLEILSRSSLKAAEQYCGIKNIQYWLIAQQCGIVSTIGREYHRRIVMEKKLQMVPLNLQNISRADPSDVLMLGQEIDDIVNAISTIAGPKENNYEGSYCSLVGYVLTELVPRILVDALDLQKVEFNHITLVVIDFFWMILGGEVYIKLAQDYEDGQMNLNGDVEVYSFLGNRLLQSDGPDPEDGPSAARGSPPNKNLPPNANPLQPLENDDDDLDDEEDDRTLDKGRGYRHDGND